MFSRFSWRKAARVICFLSLFAVVGSTASAQIQSRLTGTVTDPTGGVIPGAQVTARNLDTGITDQAVTSAAGIYNFASLIPGRYELSCELPGFKRFVQSGVVMETALTKTINVRLEVGEVTETVQVIGGTPLLEAETSTLGQFIQPDTVANMPVVNRFSGDLIKLSGTVVGRSVGFLGTIPNFSVAGGRSRNQMWMLDGGVAQNVALGMPQLSLNPPMETLREFKLETNNYSAEYGRTGNGLIIMSTRSGTNEFHGAVYEYFRNDVLDARSFFASEKPPLRYNIFGVSAGGPIVRDRTFFFFNYEGQRLGIGRTRSGLNVPHPPEIGGDFSNRTDVVVRDPVTGQPFPNNVIPENRIDPIAGAFARFYPAPNVPANDMTRVPSNNFTGNTVDEQNSNVFTGRIDHTFGPRDRIFFRFSRVAQDLEGGAVFPEEIADPSARTADRGNHLLTGSWNHDFSANLLQEVRYTFGKRLFINRALGTGSGVNGQLGLKGVDPDFFASMDISGLTRLGNRGQERLQTPIINQQVLNNWTWIRNTHELKFGFEYRLSSNKDVFNDGAGGRFNFNDRATGEGVAAFLLGWVNSASLVATLPLETRSDYWALYIQENWKVRPRFTLNLGLRWEMDTPRWEKSNRQSGFDFQAINPVSGTPGVVTFAGRDGVSKFAHRHDKNNFSPRIGLAWRPLEEWVIRAGYGISYNGAYGGPVPFTLFHGFSRNANFTSPDGGFTPAFLLQDGLPPVPSQEELGPEFGAVPVGQSPRLSPDFIQSDHQNGYAQQWNLSIQRNLGGNMLMEAAYIANVGHKLSGPNADINMIPLVNGRGPGKQDQTLRPFPQFSGVTNEQPDWGNSSYHALNLKLDKRFSEGLGFLVNYTWSKFMDDIQHPLGESIGGGAGNGLTHIELRHLDKSLSGMDVRHRFAAHGVYELPFGRGRGRPIENGFLNAVVGDWGVGFIVELRSGTPFGVIENTNRSNTFSHSQRPNLLFDPDLDTGRPRNDLINQWFDTSAFEAPGAGIFGNAPRTICCNPGFIGVDFSVHKWWEFTERYRLQFRADFFNLPNRVNLGGPETRRGRGNFGRIGGLSGDSRELQFALRLEF